MSARITIERVLRDDNDASGQTIREWRIESEPGHIIIRMKHGDGFIMLRVDDVDLFAADLQRAKESAQSLSGEYKQSLPSPDARKR